MSSNNSDSITGPRIIVIAGPRKGAIFALTEEECLVGREPSNQICLADPSVSRRHCLFQSAGGHKKVTDLDSFNGTFVNGVPVKEQLLEHGDYIAVGDVALLFLTHEAKTGEALNRVQLENDNLITRSATRLQREDALYLQPEKVAASWLPAERVARDLDALIKISTAVNSIRSMKHLQQRLLELIFEVVPAERGAILLVGDSPEEINSLFGWDRLASSEKTVHVSKTITSQVLSEGIAILSNDIWTSDEFGQAESLIVSETRSLLCVPLVLFDSVIGAIYIYTSNPSAKFDESHLQLMTAIASISAVALENALHIEWLESENKQLRTEIHIKHRMVGDSAPMRKLYQFISRVALADSTILIRGESGTGKELAAHAIHFNSPRADMPFVAVNCAAIADTLLESEFFGHEKGAFTGANAQKKGLLEVAHNGTIFLDEIGDLNMAAQAKLLRALEAREFTRVGGTQPVKVNVRLVAATNKNLEEAVRAGTFRDDLYYRLNVISFEMPPLREKREDIPLLASHFLLKYSQKYKRRVIGISPEARDRLMSYDWPGNIRELENAIERAVVLGMTDLLDTESLPEFIGGRALAEIPLQVSYQDTLKETKKRLVIQAIKQAKGNYTKAAKILGMHPNNLHRLIRTLNLRLDEMD